MRQAYKDPNEQGGTARGDFIYVGFLLANSSAAWKRAADRPDAWWPAWNARGGQTRSRLRVFGASAFGQTPQGAGGFASRGHSRVRSRGSPNATQSGTNGAQPAAAAQAALLRTADAAAANATPFRPG